jgi:surface antigen
MLVPLDKAEASTPPDNPKYHQGYYENGCNCAPGQCTAYAAIRFNERAEEPGVDWQGNAEAWYDNSRAKGWGGTSDVHDPVVGAIISWNDGGYGHVAIVESISGTGVYISEMNWEGPGIGPTNETLSWNQISNRPGLNHIYSFEGYVYPHHGSAPSKPHISSMTQTAYVGSVITIVGSKFGSSRGSSYVAFNAVKATTYSSWSDAKIEVKVPSGISGEVDVTVHTSAGTSNAVPFKVRPRLGEIIPSSATTGSVITITGTGFKNVRGDSYVAFNSVKAASYTSWKDTEIKVKVPAGISGAPTLTVTTAGGTSNGLVFKVKPRITSITPTSGNVGIELTITGDAFKNARGDSYVAFNSSKVTSYISWKDTQIKVKVPAGISGAPTVTVNTAGGTSNGVVFKVKPRITSIAPSSGNVGTEITITGDAFKNGQGDSYVAFDSVKATSYVAWSDTEIKVKVPAGISGVPTVTVNTAGGTSNGRSFSVVPRITGITPQSGQVGTEITITGDAFKNMQGDSLVSFGTVKASEYTQWSDVRIKVKVPQGASGTEQVTVSTAGGTSNSKAFAVIPPSTIGPKDQPPAILQTFYFAEGYTGAGFQEFLSIGNPTGSSATATVTYLFSDGSPSFSEDFSIPANSRTTVDVNNKVGPGKEVSLKVESASSIICERPLYFSSNGCTGGSDVVGATSTSTVWYFAEGCTLPGFEEYICVLNPGDTDASLTFRFQTEEAGEKAVDGLVCPAHSRASFHINDLLEGPYQTSLKVESSQPVVVERPMYFTYSGMGAWNWSGGHCVIGATHLDTEYYFAEGCTRYGFEEWLTIQNPSASPILVAATYQLGDSQGETITASYSIPAMHRQTIYVPREVGEGKDVSIHLSCPTAFLAERPMYFNYAYGGVNWSGGHCVIGAPSTSTEWFFAEGCTISGFHEWLCLQNPGIADATAEITYYVQGAEALPTASVNVPANTRITVPVNQHAGEGLQLSARINVISGPGLIAERPMYFDYQSWDGGHDVMGYAP